MSLLYILYLYYISTISLLYFYYISTISLLYLYYISTISLLYLYYISTMALLYIYYKSFLSYSYFLDGQKIIDKFREYVDQLMSTIVEIRQRNDNDRRQLLEIKDTLKSSVETKEVSDSSKMKSQNRYYYIFI